MYIATVSVSPVAIIFTVLLIICWILSAIIEILIFVIDIEKHRLFSAIQQDFNWAYKTKAVVATQSKKVKFTVNKIGENLTHLIHSTHKPNKNNPESKKIKFSKQQIKKPI
jgi:hypothetical protein